MLIPVLTGPTAAGKTALALEMARADSRIEIINADSMVVYRGMDIGTAKPSAAELAEVRHHLIDIREPNEPYAAGDFVRETHAAIQDIESRGKRALIVGGTGFYLRVLFYGLWEGPPADLQLRAELESETLGELYSQLEKVDPASALRIGPADQYRLVRALELVKLSGKTPTELQNEISGKPADPRLELWIVDRAPEELHQRIAMRARQMLNEGLIDEVKRVRAQYPEARALGAVGYKEVCAFLDGVAPAGRQIPAGDAGLLQEIELATRQLVKRQRTWFKGLHAKLGPASHWFNLPSEDWRREVERVFGSV